MARFPTPWLRFGWIVFVLAGCAGKDDAGARFAEGDRRFEAGEYAAAIEAYRAGLELSPDRATGWNRLGVAYRLEFNLSRRSEWKEQELQAFRRAVEVDSTYWPAFVNLGASLHYLGQREEAAGYFRRALALHPENPDRDAILALLPDSVDVP